MREIPVAIVLGSTITLPRKKPKELPQNPSRYWMRKKVKNCSEVLLRPANQYTIIEVRKGKMNV